jgi:hypothetical protein
MSTKVTGSLTPEGQAGANEHQDGGKGHAGAMSTKMAAGVKLEQQSHR